MKVKRTDRLIDMTYYLLSHPAKLIPLTYFATKYNSAKSSISEDLVIIKETFEQRNIGTIETVSGAAGGAKYMPIMAKSDAKELLIQLKEKLEDKSRLLPGNYVYISDLLGNPELLTQIGKLMATPYTKKRIDVVMTVATKGVPLAQAVAKELGVPFVIVRRDSKVTEGATISVNYDSISSTRVERMELSKRSLLENSRVLIIDDFLKGGGTISGMISMVEEFKSKVIGIAIFIESKSEKKVDYTPYTSLLKLDKVDFHTKTIKASLGNYIDKRKS